MIQNIEIINLYFHYKMSIMLTNYVYIETITNELNANETYDISKQN